MIEMMEKEGVIGPADGAKPREVLARSEYWHIDGGEKTVHNMFVFNILWSEIFLTITGQPTISEFGKKWVAVHLFFLFGMLEKFMKNM